jgi:SNF2 family DNA or RNA helicase
MRVRVDSKSLIADVRASESMDAIYVTPRDHGTGSRVFAALRDCVGPRVKMNRSADGIRLSPAAAISLLGNDSMSLHWSEDAARLVENRQRASAMHPPQLATLNTIKARGAEYARELIADSSGLAILDDHQAVNVASMTIPNAMGLCVFDEQGTGKTVTMIYAFDLLVERDEVDLMVIVAPKSMVAEWPRDFAKFRGDLYTVLVVTGTAANKRRSLRVEADVLVLNFETAVSLEEELRALIRSKGRRVVLAVDESYMVKSIEARRTRALKRLREWCGRSYVLCGTPAPNAPKDLIHQFSLVDFGIAFQDVSVPDSPDDALRTVQHVVDTRGLFVRHLKAAVLPNLPSRAFQRFFVPLEPVQRCLYESALQRLLLDLEAIDDKTFTRRLASFFDQRAALLQIASNPVSLVPGYRETPAKLKLLDTLLADLIDRQREKVVIWSFYTASVSAIVERFSRYNPVRIDGSVGAIEERRRAISRFQDDPDTMLFVGNPAAAGAGLTLHSSRIAIYESFSNQAAHYLQSLDRIHRRGQTRDVSYLILLAEGTAEISEYERLMAKEASARELLHDPTDYVPTRADLLAEARDSLSVMSHPTDEIRGGFSAESVAGSGGNGSSF